MIKPKQHKTLGKMLQISAYKLAIAQGLQPVGMSPQKIAYIKKQVKKIQEEQKRITQYQPFTSKTSRRKPKQTGA